MTGDGMRPLKVTRELEERHVRTMATLRMLAETTDLRGHPRFEPTPGPATCQAPHAEQR